MHIYTSVDLGVAVDERGRVWVWVDVNMDKGVAWMNVDVGVGVDVGVDIPFVLSLENPDAYRTSYQEWCQKNRI